MEEDNKKKGSSVSAGAIGAVAGAALGAAAATILSNKKTRKRVVDKFTELKDQATEKAKKLGSNVMNKLGGEKTATQRRVAAARR